MRMANMMNSDLVKDLSIDDTLSFTGSPRYTVIPQIRLPEFGWQNKLLLTNVMNINKCISTCDIINKYTSVAKLLGKPQVRFLKTFVLRSEGCILL